MKDKIKTIVVGADLHDTIRRGAFRMRISIREFVTRSVREWIASQSAARHGKER